MDTRIAPFGDHPDGGKITEFAEGEEMPDYMMPISEVAQKVLEKIPQQDRVNFILNSGHHALQKEKEWLENKLKSTLLGG